MSKRNFASIAWEVISIVFAVLLALGINNYWQERSNRILGDETLVAISNEIETNMFDLDTSIMEMTVELDSLLLVKERMENEEDGDGTLGYTHPILTDNAWSTANITQAVLYIDPEIIMDISDLYTMQQMYEDFGLSYFKLFSSLDFNRKENELVVVNSNIRQVQLSISLGEQLLQGYKDFFVEHKERLKANNIEVPDQLPD